MPRHGNRKEGAQVYLLVRPDNVVVGRIVWKEGDDPHPVYRMVLDPGRDVRKQAMAHGRLTIMDAPDTFRSVPHATGRKNQIVREPTKLELLEQRVIELEAKAGVAPPAPAPQSSSPAPALPDPSVR